MLDSGPYTNLLLLDGLGFAMLSCQHIIFGLSLSKPRIITINITITINLTQVDSRVHTTTTTQHHWDYFQSDYKG